MYGHYTCRTSTLRRSTVHQGDFSDLVSLHFLPSCTMVGIPSTALLAQPSPDTLLAVAGLYLQLEKWNKWYISHARLGLLGDVDSADRNVLGLLPASVHTGQRVLPEQFVTWNSILSDRPLYSSNAHLMSTGEVECIQWSQCYLPYRSLPMLNIIIGCE